MAHFRYVILISLLDYLRCKKLASIFFQVDLEFLSKWPKKACFVREDTDVCWLLWDFTGLNLQPTEADEWRWASPKDKSTITFHELALVTILCVFFSIFQVASF